MQEVTWLLVSVMVDGEWGVLVSTRWGGDVLVSRRRGGVANIP